MIQNGLIKKYLNLDYPKVKKVGVSFAQFLNRN
jgi:hypothetical protein